MTKALICDLSSIAALQGDFERARALVGEALEIERRANDPRQMRAMGAAAELAQLEGNDEEARQLNQQIVEQLRQLGETGSDYIWAVSALAESLRRLGDEAAAAPVFIEALHRAQQAQVFTWVPETLDSVAAMIASSAPDRAPVLMGAADAARRETGLVIFDVREYETITRKVRGELEPERFEAAWDGGSTKSLSEAIADALDVLTALQMERIR